MITALAASIAVDAPWSHRVILVASLAWPLPAAAAILTLVAWRSIADARRAPVDPHVGAIVAVGAELRSGAPLRSVLAEGVLGPGIAARARSGGVLTGSEDDLRGRFGADAPLVAATLRMAAGDGGPVAEVFDSLAATMLDAGRTRRERRASMAPAVLQAGIVGGIPIVALVHLAIGGRLGEMITAGGLEAGTAVAGLCLTLSGALAIIAMAVRDARA